MTTPTARTRGRSLHRAGAPLLPPALSYVVLTVLGLLVPAEMAGSGPWTSDRALLDFFQHHAGAAHASAFFTLGSAIPFAVVTAVATTRLRTLGIDVPGRIIAQIGGTIPASMLAISGLATLAVTQNHAADSAAVVRGVYGLSFAAGGPGFVAFSGLLLAGVSIASFGAHVLPRWLAWAGVAIAVLSEVSVLSAAFDGADFLLPIGRFGGLAFILAIGFLLPSSRRELRERRGEVRAVDVS